MMTQQLELSVVSAPLAAIDRRALSQAWFSALRLAHDPPASATPRATRPQATAVERSRPDVPRTGDVPRESSIVRSTRETDRRVKRGEVLIERRAPRSPLARKIERVFLDPRTRIQRATFSVNGTRARMHVTLQTNGQRMRLVAICPPAVRTEVTQALAQARYALASRGIDLTVETEVGAC